MFDGSEAKFFAPPEKVKRAKTDFFVLPPTVAIPLRIWIESYLPVYSNKGVESVWINKDRNAMSTYMNIIISIRILLTCMQGTEV